MVNSQLAEVPEDEILNFLFKVELQLELSIPTTPNNFSLFFFNLKRLVKENPGRSFAYLSLHLVWSQAMDRATSPADAGNNMDWV